MQLSQDELNELLFLLEEIARDCNKSVGLLGIKNAEDILPPLRAFAARLDRHNAMLNYWTCGSREGWVDPGLRKDTPEQRCEEPGCEVTWRTPDACLLLNPSVGWRCRAHQPVSKSGLHTPGWRKPDAEIEAERAERKAVFAKTSRAGRLLINSNLVR